MCIVTNRQPSAYNGHRCRYMNMQFMNIQNQKPCIYETEANLEIYPAGNTRREIPLKRSVQNVTFINGTFNYSVCMLGTTKHTGVIRAA